jgi:hypothetical protein
VNAATLSWVNPGSRPPHVMFSVLTGEGIHMDIDTATESRAAHSSILPPDLADNMARIIVPAPKCAVSMRDHFDGHSEVIDKGLD